MTGKRKRSSSIRRLPRDEARAWLEGGFVDGTFDQAAVLRALGAVAEHMELAAFMDLLETELGFYRDMVASARSEPTVSEELRLADELLEVIAEARSRLEAMPPKLKAAAQRPCLHRNGVLLHQVLRDLDERLAEVSTLVVLAQRSLEPLHGCAGRKPAAHRDHLLRTVAGNLPVGLSKERTAELACEVLRAMGVPAPADPREAARIIAKARERDIRDK